MRIIFKILAAPFVLVLTLLVAVLSFLLSLSAGLLSILASVLGLLSVLMLFVEKDISTGIAGLLMAFRHFALWPACAGRMAACQAGRAERLPAGLHHGLSSGHGGQKMQKTAADPSRRLSYGKEDCLRPQLTSNPTSGPISGRPCKA